MIQRCCSISLKSSPEWGRGIVLFPEPLLTPPPRPDFFGRPNHVSSWNKKLKRDKTKKNIQMIAFVTVLIRPDVLTRKLRTRVAFTHGAGVTFQFSIVHHRSANWLIIVLRLCISFFLDDKQFRFSISSLTQSVIIGRCLLVYGNGNDALEPRDSSELLSPNQISDSFYHVKIPDISCHFLHRYFSNFSMYDPIEHDVIAILPRSFSKWYLSR